MSWRAEMGAETAPHVAARAPQGAEVLVRAAGLSFGYAHEAVLRDVTLEVCAGEFVALGTVSSNRARGTDAPARSHA